MKKVWMSLLLAGMGFSASAGPMEDAARAYLESLYRSGERQTVFVPGLVGRPVHKPYIMDRVDRMPFGQRGVLVFVSDRCPSCNQAVDMARRLSTVSVEVLDVSNNKTAREAFAHTRAGGLPAIVVRSQILIGLDEPLLQTVLGRAGWWIPDAGVDKP